MHHKRGFSLGSLPLAMREYPRNKLKALRPGWNFWAGLGYRERGEAPLSPTVWAGHL